MVSSPRPPPGSRARRRAMMLYPFLRPALFALAAETRAALPARLATDGLSLTP